MSFKPTPEQEECIAAFGLGKKLRINAYAGTGKTSTLTLLAKSTDKLGTYMAFNRSIADEARRKFPETVSCSTTHGMAFRAMCKTYSGAKMTGNLNGGFIAAKLNLRPREFGMGVSATARGWGNLLIQTIARWQRSGRDEISRLDVSRDGKLGTLPDELLDPVIDRAVLEARALWEQMKNPNSDIPLGHDGYLKLWALSKPTIPGDFIMLDEAQDTNGVVLELVKHQEAPVICVGDVHQQIYEWRGATNAMRQLPADIEQRLTTSFRFGPNIAAYATGILYLLGETIPLSGNSNIDDKISMPSNPRAIITRTNSRLIEELILCLEGGIRPHIVGGTRDVMAMITATERLMAGQPVDFPMDFFGFKNWQDVVDTAEQESDPDLKRWVDLVEQYGIQKLRNSFDNLPKTEDEAPVILTTGHKSKGREWPQVALRDDFLRGVSLTDKDRETSIPQEELRLFYVAATRGQVQLGVGSELTMKFEKVKASSIKRDAA